MQRDPWGRPIRDARISNPWFDPPPVRRATPAPAAGDASSMGPRPAPNPGPSRDPFAAERAAVAAEEARRRAAREAEAEALSPGEFVPPSAPRPVEPPPVPIAAPRASADDRADLRRALADLEAAKGRVAREGRRTEEAARLRLVGELLPVLDDLDRSIAAGSNDTALLHGVELVRQGLERVLAGYGLERIATAHARFDPAVHEAIAVAPVTDPELDGVVLDEVSRGYRLGDRVQRAARVRVGQLVAP